MLKNSFSLLETILSIVVLAILLVSFNSYFSNNKDLNQLNTDLNSIENKFDKKDYSTFNKLSKNIQITLDNTENKTLKVYSYIYENKNIKIEKYE